MCQVFRGQSLASCTKALGFCSLLSKTQLDIRERQPMINLVSTFEYSTALNRCGRSKGEVQSVKRTSKSLFTCGRYQGALRVFSGRKASRSQHPFGSGACRLLLGHRFCPCDFKLGSFVPPIFTQLAPHPSLPT